MVDRRPRVISAAEASKAADPIALLERIRQRSQSSGRPARPRPNPNQLAIDHWAAQCPARFTAATLCDLKPGDEADPQDFDRARQLITAWVENPTGNLVIAGPVGPGKTHLAAAACNALAHAGRFCTFQSVGRFMDDCKPGGAGIDRYLRAEVLLLDDIGSGRSAMTPFEEDRLYCLVNERWQEMRLTIFTTNLDAVPPSAGKASELEEYLGKRINDRIRHESLILGIQGASRRTARWKAAG